MSLSLKPGVKLKGLQPQAIVALLVIYTTWEKLFPSRDCTITSATDGTHSKKSLHYKGLAWDIRTKTLSPSEQAKWVPLLKAALGGEFDVVLEIDHLHVEWDPS